MSNKPTVQDEQHIQDNVQKTRSVTIAAYASFYIGVAIVAAMSGISLLAIFVGSVILSASAGAAHRKIKLPFLLYVAWALPYTVSLIGILFFGCVHLLMVILQGFNAIFLKIFSTIAIMDGEVGRWMYNTELFFVFPKRYFSNKNKPAKSSKEKSGKIVPMQLKKQASAGGFVISSGSICAAMQNIKLGKVYTFEKPQYIQPMPLLNSNANKQTQTVQMPSSMPLNYPQFNHGATAGYPQPQFGQQGQFSQYSLPVNQWKNGYIYQQQDQQ